MGPDERVVINYALEASYLFIGELLIRASYLLSMQLSPLAVWIVGLGCLRELVQHHALDDAFDDHVIFDVALKVSREHYVFANAAFLEHQN